MSDDWPRCGQCGGIRIADGGSCLAHAKPGERAAALKRFSESGDLDASGVTISDALLKEILDAAPHDSDGHLTFSAIQFSGATFEGVARFDEASFKGMALFGQATFKDNAGFGQATFENLVGFDRATFEGIARFGGATFKDGAGFPQATFKDNAEFPQATFTGIAEFGEATFKGDAGFSGAIFEGDAWFSGSVFEGTAEVRGTGFKSDAEFTGAKFGADVPVLGPIATGERLGLDGVQFVSTVRIEADASELTCRRGMFPGGVRFNVSRALVHLGDTDLSVPSLLTGPAVTSHMPASMIEQKRPRLLSLQRANVAGLSLGNVDLADCRFAGAHNLDKLRLEAGAVFGLSPAVARWERRQVIAEEVAWRADRTWFLPNRWSALPSTPWPRSFGDHPEPLLTAGEIAGLYRSLRKGREDAKDEPGAADFYYGEMEMRRHDYGTADSADSRGGATRSVLFAYWLVSGYGLRAWRSLVALAVVTTLFAAAFHYIGFTKPPEPASYWTSLLYAFRSTVSLTDNQVTLTAWGSFFQALLRITGPVLLGLTLLALRARVKR